MDSNRVQPLDQLDDDEHYHQHKLTIITQPKQEAKRLLNGCTSLMYACQQGNSDIIIKELRTKPRTAVNRRDKSNKSALHYCSQKQGDLVAAASVAIAAPELLESADEDGFTPLHLAVIQGNSALVNMLLANKADVNALDNEGHSVVHWATVCGEIDALRAILNAGADISIPDVNGGNPLHYAAQMCGANYDGKPGQSSAKLALDILNIFLQHPNADVNVQDKDGRQPLLWAASAGSANAVLALIKAGARIESADKDGLTALHCAASRGHTECIDALINLCGAPTDLIDANGCTALHYAVTLGHADATALLLDLRADPNRQDRKGRTPAHCGCAKGQFETVRMLRDRRASMWLRNAKGDLPLHEAASSGRRELVQWLLDQRPKQINVTSNDGRTILHIAASNDNTDMCKMLIDFGADVNSIYRTQSNVVMTPLDCSLNRGYRSTAKFLQLHGGLPARKLRLSGRKPNAVIDQELVKPLNNLNNSFNMPDDGLEAKSKGNTTEFMVYVKQPEVEDVARDKQVQEKPEIADTTKSSKSLRSRARYVCHHYHHLHYRQRRRKRTSSCETYSVLKDELEENSSGVDMNRSRSNIEIYRKCKRCKLYDSTSTSYSSLESSSDRENICKCHRRKSKHKGCSRLLSRKKSRSKQMDRKGSSDNDSEVEVDREHKRRKEKRRKKDIGSGGSKDDSKTSVANNGEKSIQNPSVNLRNQSSKSKRPQSAKSGSASRSRPSSARKQKSVDHSIESPTVTEKVIEAFNVSTDDKIPENLSNKIVTVADVHSINIDIEEQQIGKESLLQNSQEKSGTIDEAVESIEVPSTETTGNQTEQQSGEIVEIVVDTVISPAVNDKIEPVLLKPVENLASKESEEFQSDSTFVIDQGEKKVEEEKKDERSKEQPAETMKNETNLHTENQEIEEIKQSESANDELFGQKVEEEDLLKDKIINPTISEQSIIVKSTKEGTGIIKQVIEQNEKSLPTIPEDFDGIKVPTEEPRKSSFTILPSDDSIDQIDSLLTVQTDGDSERPRSFTILNGANDDEPVKSDKQTCLEDDYETYSSDDDHSTKTTFHQIPNGIKASILVDGRRKRFKKRIKSVNKHEQNVRKMLNQTYQLSKDQDSGFEPSPRAFRPTKIPSPRTIYTGYQRNSYPSADGRVCSSRVEGRKPGDKNSVNMTTVHQSIQRNIRKYYIERKIFQHLLELKSLQIRSCKVNESILVKRAVDDYHSSIQALGLETGLPFRRYPYKDYTFKNFEIFLYETLKGLQRNGSNNFQNISDVYKEAERRLSPDYSNQYEKALHCTTKTHRCLHAAHAYTGIPCAAYIPIMNHHTMPKYGFGKTAGVGSFYLPKISKNPRTNKVSLELSHGNNKQLIELPTEKLDANKRYYVTFTVKKDETTTDGADDNISNQNNQDNDNDNGK